MHPTSFLARRSEAITFSTARCRLELALWPWRVGSCAVAPLPAVNEGVAFAPFTREASPAESLSFSNERRRSVLNPLALRSEAPIVLRGSAHPSLLSGPRVLRWHGASLRQPTLLGEHRRH